MDNQNIISQKKNILQFLSKRQLKDAFEALLKLAVNVQDWKISENLSDLETNYRYMLHYMFEGLNDPERDNMYRNLLRSLYESTDDICEDLLKIESSNIYFEKLRINELKTQTLADYQLLLKDISDTLSIISLREDSNDKEVQQRDLSVKRERFGSDMFNSIFVSPRATEADASSYKLFLDSLDIPVREKCLFLSALTLNLFHRFDARKVQVLMHASVSDNMALRGRAMVGLVVIMQMYDTRWVLYPELQHQLETLSENPHFRKGIRRVIIQLIRSRETEKISKKLKEEIFPEMMKFNSLAGKKLNMEDLMGETDFAEKNPEWQKELEESGLTKKLQEYSSLQMEGADVFHSTFSGLKSFPFFSDMSNWFLPFDTSYSEFTPIFSGSPKNNLLRAAIVDSGHMCNSDKYSFCLSLLQISSMQRDMMMGRLSNESAELKQLQKDAKDLNPTIEEEVISNQYIQDLYRFFKLNPYRSNFFDIFQLNINFYDKQSIAPIISDPDSMRKIALYCFEKNNFKEALNIFNRLALNSENSNDIMQKIGYCKQMTGDTEGALEAYLQADLIKPNDSWIVRRIAQLYRSLKMYEPALEYYKKASILSPDNINIELNIGHCYLELKDYENALNSYFKVELNDNTGNKALRPIGWTSFLQRKFDLSRNYYQRILANQPTIHDYLNAGHVELCTNNIKTASEYYKQAARKENDFDLFLLLFDADKDKLIEYGVDAQIFPYLLDQIRYSLD
ncbi:MAG: hypothetical protein QM660_08695 [Dysgonomonas sp.]